MFQVEPALNKGRKVKRLRVAMTAGFRKSGIHKTPVAVYDLSTDGFRIETYMGVRCGATVWLTLHGIEAQEAEAVWVTGDYVGCKFLRPLHPAVLTMIAAQASSA